MPETYPLWPPASPPNSRDQATDCDLLISQMVAVRAHTAPDAPAVVSNGLMLSYAELDRRANQIANRLIELGVGPETVVALCLPRSAESVICSLAVLKTGGAYLPLDPAYPIERLAFMLNDARPRVLITKTNLALNLGDGPWAIIDLATDREINRGSVAA